MTPHAPLIVPRRFCGPPTSGNGGWTAGALAALVDHGCPDNRADAWPAITVALRQPPPLDTAMDVRAEERAAGPGAGAGSSGVGSPGVGSPGVGSSGVGTDTVASFGGAVVARARLADADPVLVEPVPADEARAAMASYPGLVSHPFPTCVVCGPERAEADGLRIFPGRVRDQAGATRIASTWTPHPSTSEDYHAYVDEHRRASLPVTWAALDCIGGWAGDLTERLMVLANMTARVDTLPVVGEEHVVVGLARGREGRKTWTASTLYDSDGRVVAAAEHLWVAVDPAAFA